MVILPPTRTGIALPPANSRVATGSSIGPAVTSCRRHCLADRDRLTTGPGDGAVGIAVAPWGPLPEAGQAV